MTLQEASIQNTTETFNVSDFIFERTNLCFFYIGSDENMFEHFIQNFESGYKSENFYDADEFIHQLYFQNNKLPDVLFIDVPFKEAELNQFQASLKDNVLLATIPVIYSEKQLTDEQINRLCQLQLVDDIITINSYTINYYPKIMLLKQSKLYNQLFRVSKNQQIKKIEFGRIFNFLIKRTIDISIALTGILILSPFMLLIAAAIKLESKGPVFYISLRAGNGFKVFKFYKFRSMVSNADKEVDRLSHFNQYSISPDGPKFFKINNDPRITKLGKFLRNTSADELPQLLNVLIGDMSVVGNRPLPIYEAVSLTTNEFVERFTAPAGITGLWQVNKRGKADMSIEERINLDITYSRNHNTLYDLKIMAKTPIALFQKSDV